MASSGTTITLKNIPPGLHLLLRESAKRNKRSMNQEAIHVLESSLTVSGAGRISLLDLPPTRSVGRILVSPEDLISRADDLLDRNG